MSADERQPRGVEGGRGAGRGAAGTPPKPGIVGEVLPACVAHGAIVGPVAALVVLDDAGGDPALPARALVAALLASMPFAAIVATLHATGRLAPAATRTRCTVAVVLALLGIAPIAAATYAIARRSIERADTGGVAVVVLLLGAHAILTLGAFARRSDLRPGDAADLDRVFD